jgi:hypothetical protein
MEQRAWLCHCERVAKPHQGETIPYSGENAGCGWGRPSSSGIWRMKPTTRVSGVAAPAYQSPDQPMALTATTGIDPVCDPAVPSRPTFEEASHDPS